MMDELDVLAARLRDLGPLDGGAPAAWVPCPCCDEFLCTLHGGHASECPCPPIDEWTTDPYSQTAKGAEE